VSILILGSDRFHSLIPSVALDHLVSPSSKLVMIFAQVDSAELISSESPPDRWLIFIFFLLRIVSFPVMSDPGLFVERCRLER
jgi:hypothetical protein